MTAGTVRPGGTAITIYGWDTSHYDGVLTQTILNRAKSDGIAFWTHKIGEALNNTDPLAAEAFTAAHAVGFQVIGGYYFLDGDLDADAQAHRCVTVADQVAPWWRDFPGWFWQADAEASGSGLPSPSMVKRFSDTLASLTDRVVLVYASAGQYGNRLAGLGHKLWNANYGNNPTGPFKSIYPGDSFRGWNSYSGQTPLLLQYGSNATIGGLATCDANAFRGTINDLLEQIMATVDITPASQHAVAEAVITTSATIPNIAKDPDFSTLPKTALNTAIYRIRQASADARDNAATAVSLLNATAASLAGLAKSQAALQAALDTFASGQKVDTAALAAQIKAIGDAESATVTALQAQNAQLVAANAALQTAADDALQLATANTDTGTATNAPATVVPQQSAPKD